MILLDVIGEDPAQLRTIHRWQNSFCRAAHRAFHEIISEVGMPERLANGTLYWN